MTEPRTFRPSPGLGWLDCSQAPSAVHYIVSTGEPWRVHDCPINDGKPVRIGLPDAEGATARAFVAANGVKRYCRRLKVEVWRATPAQLTRQLTASEFLAMGPSFDLSERAAG